MAINLAKPNVCYNISCNSVLQSKIASVFLKSHKVGGGEVLQLEGREEKGKNLVIEITMCFCSGAPFPHRSCSACSSSSLAPGYHSGTP